MSLIRSLGRRLDLTSGQYNANEFGPHQTGIASLLLALVFQNCLIRGLTAGSVKG